MATNTPATTRLVRRARVAASLTIAWMVVELVVALWAGIAAPATTRRRGLDITSWARGRDVPALWTAGGLLVSGLLLRLRDA
jgi:hypothetical protein